MTIARIGGDSSCCAPAVVCCTAPPQTISGADTGFDPTNIGLGTFTYFLLPQAWLEYTDCVTCSGPGDRSFYNDHLKMDVFGAESGTYGSSVSSTSDNGVGVSIAIPNGFIWSLGTGSTIYIYSDAGCLGMLLLINYDAATGALNNGNQITWTFTPPSGKKVCQVMIPIYGSGNTNPGVFNALLEAWDTGGNYVSANVSVGTSGGSSPCDPTWNLLAWSTPGQSLTKVAVTNLEVGGPNFYIGAGEVDICLT